MGDAISFSISESCVSSYGVNTSERCFAKSSTFSLSLLAHGPGGVELVRIGGSDICGFFLDLIGFQMEWSSLLRVETQAAKDAFRIS